MMNTNFEKMTKRNMNKEFTEAKGRKLNKVRRDRNAKRHFCQ